MRCVGTLECDGTGSDTNTRAYSHFVGGGGGAEAGIHHATLGIKHLLGAIRGFGQGMRKRRLREGGHTKRLNSAGQEEWR